MMMSSVLPAGAAAQPGDTGAAAAARSSRRNIDAEAGIFLVSMDSNLELESLREGEVASGDCRKR